jgi:hypothetical protein
VPATSGPQYRFMQGIAHGMKPRSGHGPSKEVAEEFVHATPAKKRSMWSQRRKRRKLASNIM